MDALQSGLSIVTLILMIVSLLVSIIPALPGPALVWAVGMIYAAATGFERLTLIPAVIITLLMIVGSTTNLWTPFFGIKSRGVSCASAFGAIIGGLIGTFVIPVVILGTLIGAMVGALLVELVYYRQTQRAIRAAGFALEAYITSIVIEFVIGVGIIAVFIVSVLLTG